MRKNKQKIRLILLILLATLLLSCYLFTIVKLERLTASSWRAEEDEDEAEDGFVMAQCQKILEGGFVLGVGDGKNGGGDDGDIEKVGNNYGEKNNNVNKYDNNNNNNKYDNNNNNNNELNNIKMPSFYDVSSQSKSQNNRNNNDNKDINSYVVSKINNRNDNEEINNNNNGNNDNNKFLVKICRSYIKKIKRKNETKNKKWMNKMKKDGWKENEKKGVKDEQMKDGWIEDEWMDRKRKKEKKILKNIMTDFMAGRAYDWEDDGKKDEKMGGLFPDWMKDRVGGRSDEKLNEKIDRRKNGETEKTNENDRGIDKEADRKMGGRMDEYKLKKEDLDLLSNLIGQHQKYRRQKLQMEDDEFYEMKKKYATYLNIHPYVPNMPVWKVFQNRISNFSLYQLDYNPTNHYQDIFHNNNDNNNNDDNNNNNNNNNNDNGEDNDEDNYKKYNNEGRLDNNNNKDNNNNDNNNNNNNNNISNAKMVASLLSKLATLKITFVTELPFSGTQIKYILTLNHTYNAIFKPKRVSRDDEESMDTYYMYEKERHTAEIAAFHLDRIFGFMRVPPTAGRVVNIVTDIKEHLPHHSKKNFYLSPVNNLCFFGKCRYFCDPAHAVCGAGEALEGSLGAFLPNKSQASWHSLKNPWSRSYSKHNKSYWEKNLDGEEVCNHFRSQHPFTTLTSILNLIDIHIFDFLLGNKDRHHFTSFHQFRNSSTFVLIDNGKGFGRSQDITDILAPLTQCCLVRYTTLKRLYHFQTHTPLSQLMATSLSQDVLPNILPTKHLKALDRRVMIVLMKVLECVSKASSSHHVIKDDDVIAT